MHIEQASVDLVALAQHLVQLHLADHSPQVGHGQLGDGEVQIGDLDRPPLQRPSPE